jgi:cytochrome bd-type quinol oxidase subunit 2
MDAIVIIIFTSIGWLVTFVVLCIKAYSKGIDTGANMLSNHLKQRAQAQRDAMLSEMDGVDKGNGTFHRISHGELVQMEAAVRNQTQQNGEKQE